MFNLFGNKSGFDAGPDAGYSQALSAIDALYEREMQANMAALAEQRRKTRMQQSATHWVEYWPFALGVVISCFVPQVHALIESFRPWGMWIVFPFASILGNPEMNFANNAIAYLPVLFMYAQYPLEGLLARFGMRGHVTPGRVFGQVLVLHLFAIAELWLVNGPWGR